MATDRNILQKIGDAVVDFAPGIASVLAMTGVGAPAAGAVAALGALGKAFGLGSTATPEDVLSAVSADPEIRLKAMVAENDFKVKMRDFDIQELKEGTERLKTQLADVQSARIMNIEGVKATGKRDAEDKFFDWIFVIGFFLILAFMLWRPPAESTNLGLMVGAVITGVLSIINFRKGSTASGNTKTDMIYNSTPNMPKKEV
jgi:hypothetical protein